MTQCRFIKDRFIPIEYSTTELAYNNGSYYSICIIYKGTAILKINGEKCCISAPLLLCIQPHSNVEILKSRDLKLKSIMFAPDFINRNLTVDMITSEDFKPQCKLFDFPCFDIFYNNDDIYNGIIPVEQSNSSKIEYLFDSIIEQLSVQPDNMWSCRARMSLLKVFDFASKLYNYTFTGHIENNTIVDCVLNYIEFNFDKNVSIETFCKWYNTNRTTLMKEFKKATGKTINDFIIDKRLEVSRQILEFTNLSIEETAQKCGFESASYFSKQFKKRVGVAPSVYRNRAVESRKKYYGNKQV